MQRHTDVLFEFLSAAADPDELRGTVITRDHEMVLEVELPRDRPYLIKGRPRHGYFEGDHEGLPGNVPVHAKWTCLDDTRIGIWVEQGTDFLFTFRLASARESSEER
jgi:hypothetical protein